MRGRSFGFRGPPIALYAPIDATTVCIPCETTPINVPDEKEHFVAPTLTQKNQFETGSIKPCHGILTEAQLVVIVRFLQLAD
jgi:hypothetical protein